MSLLIPKARAALERYGHQVVIGNDLHRRKFEVVFVSRETDGHKSSGAADAISETWLRLDDAALARGKEIEEDIICELVRRHRRWTGEE